MSVFSFFMRRQRWKDLSGSLAKPKRRIQNELKRINMNEDTSTHCSLGMVGNNHFSWQGAIMGPSGTPYEGGVFFLSIEIPAEYPFKPPNIRFTTKVYHPNVDRSGKINVDILGRNWSPALTLEKLLLSLCCFLSDPDPEDPLKPICRLYLNDRMSFNQKAREWTIKYAMS